MSKKKQRTESPRERESREAKPPVRFYKRRKTRRRTFTPDEVIRAIKGSGGRRRVIAERLQCSTHYLHVLLGREREEWDKVRLAFSREVEVKLDEVEDTVYELSKQRRDLSEAGRNARWLLQKRREALYGRRETVTVEGGEKPLQVRTDGRVEVSLELIKKLPVEARRALLEAVSPADGKRTEQEKQEEKSGG